MIELKKEVLQLGILQYMLEVIEEGRAQHLVDAGMEPELLDALRELKMVDVGRLASLELGFQLTVDVPKMSHQLRVLKASLSQQHDREFFLSNGAPVCFMRMLFRMSKSEVMQLRSAMGLKGYENQPIRIAASVRAAIEDTWVNLMRYKPPMWTPSIWKELHQKFDGAVSFDLLYSAVMDFEKLKDKSPANNERGG